MAKCLYYYSYLHPISPPPLDNDFVKQATMLSKTNDEEVYMEFFENYGTHYATEVAFGAKYIFQHKMSESAFKTASSKSVSVSVQASYSGWFSVSGGFGMSSEQRQAAESFSQSVETTTISIGAPPPANGDAMTWASTVKDSPIPMEYKLVSIEKLFETESFFRGNENVNLTHIHANINKYKSLYCQRLFNRGEVDSCEALTPGIKLEGIEIEAGYFLSRTDDVSINTCIQLCLQNDACVASEHNARRNYCDTYNRPSSNSTSFEFEISSQSQDDLHTFIYPSKIRVSGFDLQLNDVAIASDIPPRQGATDENVQRHCNLQACRKACFDDTVCFGFTYCDGCNGAVKCKLYSEKSIARSAAVPIETDKSDSTTVFISRNDEWKNKQKPAECRT